jgi:hypothetical protein
MPISGRGAAAVHQIAIAATSTASSASFFMALPL